MSWTQKELEDIYKQANEKGIKDPEFRKQLEKDAKAALAELAGRELPDGFQLKMVDGDSKYASAYLTPDFTGGELDLKDLKSVSGGEGEEDYSSQDVPDYGISVALIVSVCGAAESIGGCGADVCGAQGGCVGDVCAAAACGAAAGCVGAACGAEATGVEGGCVGAACGAAATGAEGGCVGAACGAEATGAEGGCYNEACGAAASGAEGGCSGATCGAAACGAEGG